MAATGVFRAPLLALRVGARWPRHSGSLQKKSTERVLFFVYSLLLSTDLPGAVRRCAVGAAPAQPLPAPPRVRPSSRDKEALSAALPRTWFQGVPTDQFDPGLNKEKCVWIRNPRCVLLFPSCSRLCVPTGGPALALGLLSSLRRAQSARLGSPGPHLGAPRVSAWWRIWILGWPGAGGPGESCRSSVKGPRFQGSGHSLGAKGKVPGQI